jgi:hypothetical protein
MSIRELNKVEELHVTSVLNTVITEFDVWKKSHETAFHILEFASYEGCGGGFPDHMMNYSSVFALADHLVSNHDFQWCKVKIKDWHQWAIRHKSLSQSIIFQDIYDGKWNKEEYDEGADRPIFDIVLDSHYYIIGYTEWMKSKNKSETEPEYEELLKLIPADY